MAQDDPARSRALISQRWTDNAFLHWQVPPELLRAHLPHPLHLDTFGGEAWLSLVALRVRRARPARLPGFFGASYAQVNLRTYVSYSGEPGLFFLGMHFSQALLAAGASVAFGVPSRGARLRFAHLENELTLQVDPPRRGGTGIFVRLGIGGGAREPEEGELDHWLHERYRFFSLRGRSLLRTQVRHTPWRLSPARVAVMEGSLDGVLERFRLPDHAAFAQAKDAVLFAPERVARIPAAEIGPAASPAP